MFENGPTSGLGLSQDVDRLFLHNIDLLDLCLCDMHMQRVKREQHEGKVII